MNLAGFTFRNSRGILLLVLFLCALGGIAARRMPSAILPDFPFPRLVVIVGVGEMAIPDVILRVTRPLETAASGVPGARLVRSKTARGSLELSVDFDWGTDMFEAFTRLNANVAALRSSLPPEAQVQVEWVNPSSFPVIGYSLTADGSSGAPSPRDLLDLANLNVVPRLSRLNGVYRVFTQGGEVREYQVLLQPDELASTGITPEQVAAALNQTSFIQSVGRFTRHYQGYLVLVDAQPRTKEDLLDVVVASKGVKPIRVRDVATIREGDLERQQVVTADGRQAVLLNILKQPGASTADVSREVKSALAELQSHLPPGVHVSCFYDEADLLHESLDSLRDSILIGAVLAIGVLLLFLRSWRSTLVVLLCLPVTVLIAFLGLKLCGQTLNLMTLGGLAVGLGLIIDDVVVTLENIYRHVELGKPPLQAALDGAAEIQKPMVGSTLTTVAVFLPMAFLSEITGALFAPISITLTLLLITSVVIAVTVVPLIASRLLAGRRHTPLSEAQAAGRPGQVYDQFMGGALRSPLPVLAGALGLALIAAALVPGLPSGMMPDMDEGAFVLDYATPGGTTLQTTDQKVRAIEEELLAMPEVAAYSRRTGQEMGFFTTEPNTGDIMVKLKPRVQRKRSMRQVMEDVVSRCEERLPGVELEPVAPIADRVGDIAGEPTPIDVKIFGDDPATAQKLAEQVNQIVEETRGTAESIHEVTVAGPDLVIRVDPRRAGMLGLSPKDVATTLETSMLGNADTSVVSGERVIGVRVVYPRLVRRTLDQVREMTLLSRGGRRVPLSAIAEFAEVPGSFEVRRENQKPVMEVQASLRGRDLGSANREVQARIAREVKLPAGYSIEYGGLYATQRASFEALLTVLLLGMFLVYLVTLFQYNRFGEPTALVLAAAFALVGVVGALKLTGAFLNVSSLTGAVMIFGMVLTNGIVLMDTIANRQAEGLPLREAILAAGKLRLRPVFMTATIAVLTLMPLALGLGAGAEMQQPLAIAVIGGLVVSPFFTLILAPLLLFLLRRGN